MNDNQMVKEITEAYEQKFITSVTEEICIQECEDCPADATCRYLSEGGSYPTFQIEYGKLLERRPELKELDGESTNTEPRG